MGGRGVEVGLMGDQLKGNLVFLQHAWGGWLDNLAPCVLRRFGSREREAVDKNQWPPQSLFSVGVELSGEVETLVVATHDSVLCKP